MESKRSLVHAAKYFVATTVFAVVGLALAAGGVAYWLSKAPMTTVGSATVPVPGTAGVAGLFVALVGIAIWQFGKAWALYHTMINAQEEALAETFDTQRVKSDIVSVLDDRLADMQQDLQSVNREVRDLKQDGATNDRQF